MECEYDPDLGEDASVLLIDTGPRAQVRMWNRVDPWSDGSIQVCVQIRDDGLEATAHGVTLGVMGDGGFASYFTGLAESFTGWDDTRMWDSLDHDLRVDAVLRSGGHVDLTWTLGPWKQAHGTWTASVVVTIEAGEQMRTLAAQVSRFLRPTT